MSWLSGGVLFAVGVALWAAYLLPSMLRRRQVQAAEQEAAQLQHALQVLAETGELPDEALSPRERLAERKRIDKLERSVERENLRVLHDAESRRKADAKRAKAEARHSDAARRASLLRLRMTASWTLLLAVLTIIGGTVAVFFGVTWMIAGAGLIAAVTAVVLLRTVVRGLAQLSPVTSAQAVERSVVAAPAEVAVPTPSRRWQPRPLPSPLHLAEGSAAAATIASNDAVEALRRRAREVAAEAAQPAVPSVSAARARAAAMAAHPATYGKHLRSGAPLAQPAARTAPLTAAEQVAARYAHLDSLDVAEASFDITEVLQRRRAV